MSIPLLIIDELRFEAIRRERGSLLFRLIAYRDGHGAILGAMMTSVRAWAELLVGDNVLSATILDRLLHGLNVLDAKAAPDRLCAIEDRLIKERFWARPLKAGLRTETWGPQATRLARRIIAIVGVPAQRTCTSALSAHPCKPAWRPHGGSGPQHMSSARSACSHVLLALLNPTSCLVLG
ncbi:MAG: ATP-binding protein [Pseudomonadota bacterium]